MVLASALNVLRRPEYTGANRCLPCTAVNAAIAAAIALLLAVALPVRPVGAVVVGGAVLVVAGGVIYLRGYLVPGTPWLTRTYLPDWFLRYFEHGPPEPAGEAGVDPAAVLDVAGAVTECEHVDDLCLTDEFRAAWFDRMTQIRDTDATRDELAAMLDLPADALDLKPHGGAFVAFAEQNDLVGRRRVGQWESPGAFLADMAAASVLDGRYPPWSGLGAGDRGRVLNGLRVFLDECPSCGGDVAFGEETVESCCRSKAVVAVTCEDCGDRLFEADQPAAG